MSINRKRAGIGIFLALTMVLSVFAVGAVGAAPSDELSFEGEEVNAPNPGYTVDDLTIARHPASQGLSDEAMAGIYDDSGEWVDDPIFTVNTSSPEEGVNENPYTFKPGHVDDEDFGVFPRTGTNDDGEQLASAVDAAEWSTDETGSVDGTVTVSDTEVAEGVDAVRIATSGMTAGDTVTASYSNWTSELDSDESKRVLQLAADVDTLDSGTLVDINVTDESGDVKQVTINSSADAANEDVLADATGDSYVTQVKLDDLGTVGAGDWSNIESIDVSVHDADADVSFSWIDMESKGKELLGVERVDSDGDEVFDETNELYQAQGAISVYSMETVGDEFNNAVFNYVSFPAEAYAEDLEGDEGADGVYQLSWDSADSYPSYDAVLNVSYRLELPTYIDASYSGVEMTMEQDLPTERFIEFGYAEGVSDETEFGEVTHTDILGNLAGAGEVATIDDTIQPGSGYVVTIEQKVTEDEKGLMLGSSGGAAAPPGEDTGLLGGVIDFFTSIPGMLMGLGGSILGLNWLRNRSG